MKPILKVLLKYYLKYITKLVLVIHRPTIIAIAGSTNKTFVKDRINKLLRQQGVNVRSNPKNFNTEIGLPLAILNLPSGYSSYRGWLSAIWRVPGAIFQSNFPKYLVLELGVSNYGDMKYLLSIVRPRIAVIADITQRYLEGFDDMDKLVGEYEYLVKKTKKNGLVVLNYDNIRVRRLAEFSHAQVEFFGTQEGAHYQAIKVNRGEDGQIIKVSHQDIVNDYKIKRFGDHHIGVLLIGLIIKKYAREEYKKN